MTNEQRTDLALSAVRMHSASIGATTEPMKDQVVDLLCNLRHMCGDWGIEINDALRVSETHYKEEIG